jgi:para-nitrobenzyl esterase
MMSMNNPTYSGPMIDGRTVVEGTEAALRARRQARVPVLIGANSNEFGFMSAKNMEELFSVFGPDAGKARRIYDRNNTNDVRALAMLIGSDRSFVEPARFVARQIRAAGQPAYLYRFSYVAESMRGEWKAGAPHATEIPYVFNTVAARYGDKLTAADKATAEAAQAYWIAFARTGNPNGAGRPDWPVYDPKQDKLMNFTNTGRTLEPDPWHARLDLLEALANRAK